MAQAGEGRRQENGQKRQAFIDAAETRTVEAIRAIRAIAELNDNTSYEFGVRDVRKIAWALNREIETMKKKMMEPGEEDKVEFHL